ncbi:hypothetical protein [Micromonospora tarapacensis]|uniref:hypothetical protein n=1 Tax=Micromonospora tarapacensis TaxID=2835305 RepID=UPI001E3E08D6|nr:hypothetical protein [Micromonospora tarapacensis]
MRRSVPCRRCAPRWWCSACTDYPTSMVAISDLASGNYVIHRRVPAGAFVATAPLLVVLVIGGRRIVRGIVEGAVKS